MNKFKYKCGFKMRATTIERECTRYSVLSYENNIVLIEKVILSKDDLSKSGFKKITDRPFWGMHIWAKCMSFKLNTLMNIALKSNQMNKK